MADKETVETAEVYYDGTTDEEHTEEVEESTEEVDIADPDDEEDYFDLDDDAEENDESDEGDEDHDDDDTDEDNEDEEKVEPADSAPENKEDNDLGSAVKKLLDALEIKDVKDPVAEIKKLTADALGVSEKEYLEREASAAAFEAQMQRDIEAIHEAYPAAKKYKSLKELPNKEKFAALMDSKNLKLTVVEAFAATHPDIVKAHRNAPKKNESLRGTKDHIKSNVPKGAKDNSTVIPKAEMEAYREMFPDLSKEQIKKLYKNANN